MIKKQMRFIFDFLMKFVVESIEAKQGVIMDLNSTSKVVSIEIMNAPEKYAQSDKVEYEVA